MGLLHLNNLRSSCVWSIKISIQEVVVSVVRGKSQDLKRGVLCVHLQREVGIFRQHLSHLHPPCLTHSRIIMGDFNRNWGLGHG